MSISAVLAPLRSAAHYEPQSKFEAQNEPLVSGFEAHFEPPTSDPDLVPEERTHIPRAREVAAQNEPQNASLPLLGQPPLSRCAHPYRHAWCEGRVHVPRDLHFEFLDRLGSWPGETRAEKVGRLIAFYAADQAQLPATTDVGNPFKYWNAAFDAWVGNGERPRETRLSARELADAQTIRTQVYRGYCPHDPTCVDGRECARVIALGRRVS